MEHERTTWPTVALMAHDHMKQELLALVDDYVTVLAGCNLAATRDTGSLIARRTGLPVALLGHGPSGGDLEVAALAVTGHLAAVVFLRDPINPGAGEPPLEAVLRACDLHSVPLATNLGSARAVLAHLAQQLHQGAAAAAARGA